MLEIQFLYEGKIPGINHYYENITKYNSQGKSYTSRKISKLGKDFKRCLGDFAWLTIYESKYKKDFPIENKNVSLIINYCFKDKRTEHDVDNILKPILDSLENIAYVNDKQINFLQVKKWESDFTGLDIKVKW